MPIAEIQLPDGRIAELEVDEGVSEEEILVFARTQFGEPQEEVTPQEVVTPEVGTGDLAAGNVLSMLDVPIRAIAGALNFGGTVLHTGRGLAEEAVKRLPGLEQAERKSQREIFAEGREFGEGLTSGVAPFELVAQKLGLGEAYQQSFPQQGMQQLGAYAEQFYDWVEKTTGGAVTAPAAATLTEMALAGMGAVPLKNVQKKIIDKTSKPSKKDIETARAQIDSLEQKAPVTNDILNQFKQEELQTQAKGPIEFEQTPIEPTTELGAAPLREEGLPFPIEDTPRTRSGYQSILEQQREATFERKNSFGETVEYIKTPQGELELVPLGDAKIPRGLDYSQFSSEYRAQAVDTQVTKRNEAQKAQEVDAAWESYKADEVVNKGLDIEEAYRQRAESLDPEINSLALDEPSQASPRMEKRRVLRRNRQRGSIDPSVFADGARIAFKAGEDMVAKAREIYSKYGEESARIFLDTYQQEQQRGSEKPKSKGWEMFDKAMDNPFIGGLEELGGAVSTRLKGKSEELWHRARQHELAVTKQIHDYQEKADPFFVQLNKLHKAQRDTLNKALMSQSYANVEEAIKAINNPTLMKNWRVTKQVLSEIGDLLAAYGRIEGKRGDYFPLMVIDRKGLLNKLNSKEKSTLEKALNEAEERAIKAGEPGLGPIQESIIINKYLRGFPVEAYKPGFSKGRKIKEVTDDLRPFYADPTETFHAYVRRAVSDLEKSKFFGRDLKRVEGTPFVDVDVDESIGGYLARLRREGKIKEEDIPEVKELLQTRFGKGEQSPSKTHQAIRNLLNVGLIGNYISAITQFGDIAPAIAIQGMKPALTSLAKTLTGKKDVRAKDFGLADHISEEFNTTSKVANKLNSIMKATIGPVDIFMKDIYLNAAFDRLKSRASSDKGVKWLADKYGRAFGDEFPELVQELKSGKIGRQTEAALWHELSDVQPVSKLEMPEMYLKHPQGRIAYAMKSFMLKQADLVRTKAYNEIRKGNVSEGLANLARLGFMWGVAGTSMEWVKDWILGRDPEFDSADIPLNIMKTFAWSQYATDQLKAGKPIKALGGIVAPPFQMFDEIISDPTGKGVRYMLPGVGPVIEQRLLGGAQRTMDNKKKRESRLNRSEFMKAEAERRKELRKFQKGY